MTQRRLRIALLTYRGKPHCGGQGVYTRHLAKALTDLGHHVEVFSGQPYPILDEGIELHKLASLDIWNDQFPGRSPAWWEVETLADMAEVWTHRLGTFAEPLAFSMRAYQTLRERIDDFDVVHDNQTLGYGILALQKRGLPVLATIHHPITVDLRLELEQTQGFVQRWGKRRWYGFTRMQTFVAKRMKRIVTVSQSSKNDICADHHVDAEKVHIVPVGVDTNLFRPLDNISRIPGMIVTTASADVAMKGLHHLLEAVAKLRETNSDVHLVVIGKPKEGSLASETLNRLNLGAHVEWVSGVSDTRIVELYAQCCVACVPSLYEGFSLPAIEAMSAQTALVTTTGGALSEVVGPNGEAALTVEPGSADLLSEALAKVLHDPELARRLGNAGRQRVLDKWSWKHTAEATVEQYYELLGVSAPQDT